MFWKYLSGTGTLLIMLTICSCGNSGNKKTTVSANDTFSGIADTDHVHIKIGYKNDKKPPKAKIEEVVQLETREDALLGSARLHVATDHYVVSDEEKIVTFTKDGKVVNVLSPVGRGPKEVINLYKLVLENDIISIDNHVSNKLLNFDLYGNLISIIDEPLISRCNESFNGRYFINTEHKFMRPDYETNPAIKALTIVSETGEIVNAAIDIIENKARVTMGKRFQKTEDYLLYRPTFYPTIYKIDKRDSISLAYEIDFGNYWPSKENIETDNIDMWGLMLGGGDQISAFDFQENDRFLIIQFARSKKGYSVCYDRINGMQYLDTPEAFPASILHSPLLATADNKFISYIMPTSLPAEIVEMDLDIDEEDNPLIVVWSIE